MSPGSPVRPTTADAPSFSVPAMPRSRSTKAACALSALAALASPVLAAPASAAAKPKKVKVAHFNVAFEGSQITGWFYKRPQLDACNPYQTAHGQAYVSFATTHPEPVTAMQVPKSNPAYK